MSATIADIKKRVADLKEASTSSLDRTALLAKANEVVKEAQALAGHARSTHTFEGDPTTEILKGETPENVLLTKSDNAQLEEFKEWQDNVLLITALLSKRDEKCNPRTLKLWKAKEKKFAPLIKAMSDSATAGAEWVPTFFSSQLIDVFHLELRIAPLFIQINPMPQDPFQFPTVSGDADVYLTPESTSDDPSKITASTTPTSNLVLTSKKLATRRRFSEEISEDSIIAIAPFIRAKLGQDMAWGLEDALINGDVNTIHQDADVVSANDRRKAFYGLRKMTQSGNATDHAGAQVTLTATRNLRVKLGKYGVNPSQLVFITGPAGLMQLLNLDEVTTLDKYGPNATVLTGELGRLDGIPIIISEKIREDLGGDGVYDGTATNKTMIMMAHRQAFVLGTRRRLTVKSWEDIETDQQVLVTTGRWDFKSLYPFATESIVSSLYDVPTALA
jgi:HK97 family phage major capsid protein